MKYQISNIKNQICKFDIRSLIFAVCLIFGIAVFSYAQEETAKPAAATEEGAKQE